jgi:hypothetical protein
MNEAKKHSPTTPLIQSFHQAGDFIFIQETIQPQNIVLSVKLWDQKSST